MKTLDSLDFVASLNQVVFSGLELEFLKESSD